MQQTLIFYIGLFVTLYTCIGLSLDTLCYLFGRKLPVKNLQLSYYANYSQVGDVYHLQGQYTFEINGQMYTAKRMNYLGLAAGALSKKRVEKHIEKVKKRGQVYVFMPYPKINCLVPFYYSWMFFGAIILFAPLALWVV